MGIDPTVIRHRRTTSTAALTSCCSSAPNHSHATVLFMFLIKHQINFTSRLAFVSLHQCGGAVFQIRYARKMFSSRVRICSRPRSRGSPSTRSSSRTGCRGRARSRSCCGGTMPTTETPSSPSPAPSTRTKGAARQMGARRQCGGGNTGISVVGCWHLPRGRL